MMKVLSEPNSRFVFIAMSIIYLRIGGQEAVTADQLRSLFGFTADKTAMFYFSMTFVGLPVCLLALLMPDSWNKVYYILASVALNIIGCLLTGPSKLLNLPLNSQIVFTGMLLLGIG